MQRSCHKLLVRLSRIAVAFSMVTFSGKKFIKRRVSGWARRMATSLSYSEDGGARIRRPEGDSRLIWCSIL